MAIYLTRRALTAMPFALAAGSAFAAEGDLLEGAKKEGQLVWYTTLVVGQIVRPLIARFEKKYPGVKVSYVPAPWQETAVRILNEGRAGQPKGDLFDGGSTVYPLDKAGFVQTYLVESAAGFPAAFRDPKGLWTANIIQPSTPAVNTDQVKAADIPKTYEDLLLPRWKGRMAWPDSPSVSGPPGLIGNILIAMGQDKGMEYLEKLAAQKIANVPSNQRVVLDQNIAGQYPLVLHIYNYHAAISATEGAPVEWLKLPPTMVSFGSMGLVKNSPHPNAAKLFLEFSMSAEGQQIYADAGYIPANPAVPSKTKGLRPEDGNYPANILSAGDFLTHEAEWLGIYRKMFT
ncbi:ABC transporter substrate-binding protein [Acidisphaera sp. L21]|uniref:ABC transporter substrate-binding protein n=1 Tax=Acidisphaera sp. L21 TaxID=1641851 RepID=UPI00131C5601|nr:extracellular solute-binding protein [Acidisphaera sp. L21]